MARSARKGGDRPSGRPTKRAREILKEWDGIERRLSRVRQRIDGLVGEAEPLRERLGELERELGVLLAEYQDETIRAGGLRAVLEHVPARTSATPRWGEFRDWVLAKLGGIRASLRKEAEAMLESSKSVTPASKRVHVERE
jgi:hypothetical protein